jgi:hypothetical protein
MSDLFQASAGKDSLRWAMSVIVLTKILATWQFTLAGKHLDEDIAAARSAAA